MTRMFHTILRFLPLAALISLLGASATAWASGVRVTHIGGDPVVGKIASYDAEQQSLHLRDIILAGPEDGGEPTEGADRTRIIDAREIEEITWSSADAEEIPAEFFLEITLTTGDVLIGRVLASADFTFTFESMSFGTLALDSEWVKRLLHRTHHSETPFVEDPELAEGEVDAIYTTKMGTAKGALDAVTLEGVDWGDNDILEGLPWAELLAVTRAIASAPMREELQVIATCRNGERFTGRLLSYADRTFVIESTAEPYTTGGTRLRVSVAEDRLMSLTFRHGKFTYLSDLTPRAHDGVVEYPYFGGPDAAPDNLDDYWFHYRNDAAVGGGALTLQTSELRRVVYAKGLGVHSYSRLSFELNGKYATVLADIGVDAAAGRLGSVVFRVYADDALPTKESEGGEPLYDSGILRRSAPLQSITVNVRTVKVLHLVVDFGDNGDIQDHANWCKARAIKD